MISRASLRRHCGTYDKPCRSSARPLATCIPPLWTANTIVVLEATGKVSEERAIFADAAAVRRTVLWPDHLDTKAAECGAR